MFGIGALVTKVLGGTVLSGLFGGRIKIIVIGLIVMALSLSIFFHFKGIERLRSDYALEVSEHKVTKHKYREAIADLQAIRIALDKTETNLESLKNKNSQSWEHWQGPIDEIDQITSFKEDLDYVKAIDDLNSINDRVNGMLKAESRRKNKSGSKD